MISKAYSIGVPDTLEILETNGHLGLENSAVEERTSRFGKNHIPEKALKGSYLFWEISLKIP